MCSVAGRESAPGVFVEFSDDPVGTRRSVEMTRALFGAANRERSVLSCQSRNFVHES